MHFKYSNIYYAIFSYLCFVIHGHKLDSTLDVQCLCDEARQLLGQLLQVFEERRTVMGVLVRVSQGSPLHLVLQLEFACNTSVFNMCHATKSSYIHAVHYFNKMQYQDVPV